MVGWWINSIISNPGVAVRLGSLFQRVIFASLKWKFSPCFPLLFLLSPQCYSTADCGNENCTIECSEWACSFRFRSFRVAFALNQGYWQSHSRGPCIPSRVTPRRKLNASRYHGVLHCASEFRGLRLGCARNPRAARSDSLTRWLPREFVLLLALS